MFRRKVKVRQDRAQEKKGEEDERWASVGRALDKGLFLCVSIANDGT